MNRRMTGLFDRKNREIGEGDEIKYIYEYDSQGKDEICKYKVCYGKGTFDSGAYEYIGFYLKDEEGNTDGHAPILFCKDDIEIV
jgi:hypothetical protein